MDVLLARLASTLRSVGRPAHSEGDEEHRPPRVLFLNAKPSWSQPVTNALINEGVQALSAEGQALPSDHFDCIVLNVDTVESASELIDRLRKHQSRCAPRIVVVGESQRRAELVDAMALGADDYLPSSADLAVVTARLHAQLRRKQLEDENETARENLIRHRMELDNQTQIAAARAAIAEELRIARDVAEQKAHEAESLLAQNEAVLRSMADGLIIADLGGRIVQANQAAKDLLGVPDSEQLAALIAPESAMIELRSLEGDIVPPEEWPLRQALRGVGVCNLELQFVRLDTNTQFLASFNAVPVSDREGRRILAALTFRDITGVKRSEEMLRKTEQLAVTGRLAASIAHEINNPLSAVMNLLYLAEQRVTRDRQTADLIDSAQKELRRIAEITRQTLAFYREWNRPVETDVCAMVADVVDLFSLKLNSLSVEVRVEVRCAVHPCVYPGELRQAISNVVLNAIEASPRGSYVRMRIRQASSMGVPGIRITVADQGHGIPVSFYPELFKPFSSLKESRGTGLGLWVTQAIVARHGGVIRFRSRTQLPSGTVFTLFVPLEPPAALGPDNLGRLFRDVGRELLSPRG